MAVMHMNDNDEFDQRVSEFFRQYHDRGMQKWAGFYLSDHTLKINKKKKQEKIVYEAESSMSEAEISQTLFWAFSNHYQVKLQLKELDGDDQFKADISGFISGYYEDQVIVATQKISLDNINHVELIH